MRWVERERPAGFGITLLEEGFILGATDMVSAVEPAEERLYTCECGVTVGPKLVVSHLESHGKEAPPERLAGMVEPASEARGGHTSIAYEPNPNAGRRLELGGECEAEEPREWCGGLEAGSVVYQCAECYADRSASE